MTVHLSPQDHLSNRAHRAVSKNRQLRTGLWTIVCLVVALIGVLLLSTIDTPAGEPWLESSAIAQTLATLGLVAAAVVPTLVSTRRDASVVREQVQNSHTINQRDDMDQKHDAITELVTQKFESLRSHMDVRFEAQGSDIRGVRRDVGRAADAVVNLQQGHAALKDDVRAVKDDVKSLRSTHISVARDTGTIHVVTDADPKPFNRE